MDIVITKWALDSYLDLFHQKYFTKQEYKERLRPDVLLLKDYPSPVKFNQPKFWSVAQDASGKIISDAFKMKWHQVGNGNVQLRLPVGMFDEIFLCEAYVKANTKQEKRKLFKLKTHLQLIRENKHTVCGRLT